MNNSETFFPLHDNNTVDNDQKYSANNQNAQKYIVVKKHSRLHRRAKVSPLKTCPENATGQFVYEISCNKFLNCWKGRGFVQNCATGTLFNPETLECDFPHKVTCISGPRTPLEHQNILSEENQATCPSGFSGLIPHYTDCSKFINCNNGIEIVMDCAPGTLFDVKSNICNHPYVTTCANTPGRQVTNFLDNNISNSSVHYGYANDFVIVKPYREHFARQDTTNTDGDILQNDRVLQTAESSNLGYKINIDRLHRGSNAQRRPGQLKHNINDRLNGFSNVGTQNFIHQQSSISDHENSRHNFNQANRGISDHLINQNTNNNQYNGSIHFSANQERGYGSTVPHQFKQNIKCPADFVGLLPHPSICAKFLNCANGQTFIQDCGPGTVFNPRLKVCDYPYRVKCADTSHVVSQNTLPDPIVQNINDQLGEFSTNQNQYESKSNLYIKCPTDFTGLLPYPQICSMFLNCIDGQTIIQKCSPGRLFNPHLKVCDYSENVKCENAPSRNFANGEQFGGVDQTRVLIGQEQDRWGHNNNEEQTTTLSYVFPQIYERTTERDTVTAAISFRVHRTSSQPEEYNGNTETTDPIEQTTDQTQSKRFPATDTNADYVFEDDDFIEVDASVDEVKDVCNITDFYCDRSTCVNHLLVCDGKMVRKIYNSLTVVDFHILGLQ